MSNWALELQGFDVIRVWIRGEANILADAPSRAPWEAALAMHLPIPDMPVRSCRGDVQVSGAAHGLGTGPERANVRSVARVAAYSFLGSS